MRLFKTFSCKIKKNDIFMSVSYSYAFFILMSLSLNLPVAGARSSNLSSVEFSPSTSPILNRQKPDLLMAVREGVTFTVLPYFGINQDPPFTRGSEKVAYDSSGIFQHGRSLRPTNKNVINIENWVGSVPLPHTLAQFSPWLDPGLERPPAFEPLMSSIVSLPQGEPIEDGFMKVAESLGEKISALFPEKRVIILQDADKRGLDPAGYQRVTNYAADERRNRATRRLATFTRYTTDFQNEIRYMHPSQPRVLILCRYNVFIEGLTKEQKQTLKIVIDKGLAEVMQELKNRKGETVSPAPSSPQLSLPDLSGAGDLLKFIPSYVGEKIRRLAF
jgi:hypothetical protein